MLNGASGRSLARVYVWPRRLCGWRPNRASVRTPARRSDVVMACAEVWLLSCFALSSRCAIGENGAVDKVPEERHCRLGAVMWDLVSCASDCGKGKLLLILDAIPFQLVRFSLLKPRRPWLHNSIATCSAQNTTTRATTHVRRQRWGLVRRHDGQIFTCGRWGSQSGKEPTWCGGDVASDIYSKFLRGPRGYDDVVVTRIDKDLLARVDNLWVELDGAGSPVDII